MTKYKINRNKPELNDEQINKHKDFNKILSNQQKVLNYKEATKPLYKKPGFMGLIILLCIVLLVYIITEKESVKENKKTKDSTQTKKKELPKDSLR